MQSFINDSLIFIAFMLAGCVALFIWAAVVLKSIGATDLKVTRMPQPSEGGGGLR